MKTQRIAESSCNVLAGHNHQIPFAAIPIADGDRTIYLGDRLTIDPRSIDD